jgi:uncharacterized membrane protein HdeD (DUF308 family)
MLAELVAGMRESSVATYDSSSQAEIAMPPSRWARALLGLVLIGGGILALGDIAFATLVSVKLIGLIAIAAGAFEIIHAFWTRGWGGFLWQILLGALYVVFGVLLLTQPESGALILTYLLGAVLVASGIIRCLLSFAHWQQGGGVRLISALVGLFAGALILVNFTTISAWALGFLLGVDLISHGIAWLIHAVQSVRRVA